MTPIPTTSPTPPFEITRASHLTLTARDLARSRDYYTEVVGLVVTDEDKDTLYLRGTQERVHHSLVLKRATGAPACVRTGMRVRGEEDLDKAKFYFDKRGIMAEFVDLPHQSRTLLTADASGTPVEYCATMPRLERLDQEFNALRGAGALCFDHYQITAPNIAEAAAYYTDLGFRVVDWMVVNDDPVGIFLHIKDSAYDVVFIKRPGPALHHFGYVVHGIQEMIRACDMAGNLGYKDCVEFGPGRHSLGHSYYVYLLDPDGHRVELLPPAIYYGDAEDGPIIHDLSDGTRRTEAWGLPPRQNWIRNASPFEGVPLTSPPPGGPEPSLEAYLSLT